MLHPIQWAQPGRRGWMLSYIEESCTEYVHGGRREFYGGVKKTTSSFENCVSEIENGKC